MIGRYQDSEINQIFSDSNKFKIWFKIEIAYLKNYLEFNNAKNNNLIHKLETFLEKINWHEFSQQVHEYDQKVHHDVIAFLHTLEDYLGEDARLIHIGLTSSDIVDTGFSLQLKKSAQIILQKLESLIEILNKQAKAHQGLVILGRTHGQSAETTTLGLKFLSFAQELSRSLVRFRLANKDICVGTLSGAVGVYAHTHPQIEEKALASLGLVPETVPTQIVTRDRHSYFFSVLAVIAGTIERFATEIRLLMHGEIQEISEGFKPNQKGSSAMPHKKNPVLSENLCGLTRLMRGYCASILENQALWHERDISHSSVERVAAPDMLNLMGFALTRLHSLVKNLVIHKNNIQKNLAHAGEKLCSQAVMIKLINNGLMRQQAYELVQKAALDNTQNNFKKALLAQNIYSYLSEEELNQALSCEYQIRHEKIIFERVNKFLSSC